MITPLYLAMTLPCNIKDIVRTLYIDKYIVLQFMLCFINPFATLRRKDFLFTSLSGKSFLDSDGLTDHIYLYENGTGKTWNKTSARFTGMLVRKNAYSFPLVLTFNSSKVV